MIVATNDARPTSAAPPDRPPVVREHEASDGYVFKYRHWTPDGPPRAYVVALHGIQSHPGWYDHSSALLRDAGYDLRYLDRRGAGLNAVDRGHAPAALRLVNDVCQILRDVRWERDREHPGVPILLLGVSWGGKLAAAVQATRPDLVDALALLYPGLVPRIRPTRWQDFKIRTAMRQGWCRYRIPIPLGDPALFTDEPHWRRFIAEDQWALHEATVGFLAASRGLDRIVAGAPRRTTCPLLLMLAGRDRIIDNPRTRRYFARVASNDKRLIEYPGAAHTLEFESDRDRFTGDLLEWLDQATSNTSV